MNYVIHGLVWEPDTVMGVRVGPPNLVGVQLLDRHFAHMLEHVLNCMVCAGGGDTRRCGNADARVEVLLEAIHGRFAPRAKR